MEKEPKSLWRKPWKGRQAFLFWLIAVAIAAFFGACVVTMTASISVPLFGRQAGFGSSLECVLIIMFFLMIAAAVVFGVCNFILLVCHWRNFKRFLFGCACFITLIALLFAEEDWRGKSEWENFKGQWEAKGENFDRNSVVPQPVPDDENFAMSPVWIAGLEYAYRKNAETWYGDKIHSEEVSNLCRLFPVSLSDVAGTNWAWHLPEPPDTLGNWAVARMSDLKPLQNFYRTLEQTNSSADIAISPKPQTPAQDVLLALSKYDPLIERLRQDSQLPYSRFPIEYNIDQFPGTILLPHLSVIKECAHVLELRAIAELQNGQSDKALADVDLMFRLADADHVEPFLICHLVRLAILQLSLQPIYEGLANHEWSDSQLADLDSKLANFDFLNDYKFSKRGEMICLQDGSMDYVRRYPGQIFNLANETTSTPPLMARVIGHLIPDGWYYQNELRANRAMEEYYLPIADTNQEILSPKSVRDADAAVAAETRHWNLYDPLEMSLRALLGPSVTVAYGQNGANLAQVAIGLERYRLAHAQYPDSLDGLTPQFIVRLPHDIINGQPLHYQQTANGQFILYSVGWNEKDDGGAVVLKGAANHVEDELTASIDRKQGDWVWRYPGK
jgi:hypothetical protein